MAAAIILTLLAFGLSAVAVQGKYESDCQFDCSERPIRPVCSSTGELFYNECDLKMESCRSPGEHLVAVPWEECKIATCMQLCTREFNPVCGSDGNIAGNPCAFLWYSVCEKYPQRLYEEPMDNCLAKKCPHDCSPNDVKCKEELKNCRNSWLGK